MTTEEQTRIENEGFDLATNLLSVAAKTEDGTITSATVERIREDILDQVLTLKAASKLLESLG
jgi:hypothetical protein